MIFLQSTCAWACYIPKKNWVYVNLDRITKSCPWPTFKVQCWWEKDVFYSGIFLWVSYESYFGYYQGVYSQYKIRRIFFIQLYLWCSDLTWTAGQNLGTSLENKSLYNKSLQNISIIQVFLPFLYSSMKKIGKDLATFWHRKGLWK